MHAEIFAVLYPFEKIEVEVGFGDGASNFTGTKFYFAGMWPNYCDGALIPSDLDFEIGPFFLVPFEIGEISVLIMVCREIFRAIVGVGA